MLQYHLGSEGALFSSVAVGVEHKTCSTHANLTSVLHLTNLFMTHLCVRRQLFICEIVPSLKPFKLMIPPPPHTRLFMYFEGVVFVSG